MYWMLMRPALGWGTFLLVHAIGIPLVYGLGKTCGAKEAGNKRICKSEHP